MKVCKMVTNRNILNRDVIHKLKIKQEPIIIFGAGVVGEALYQAATEVGIKVDCFCDNNFNKTKSLLYNLEIIYTPKLKEKFNNAIFLISAADIKDVVEQLNILGYYEWYEGSELLRNIDLSLYHFSAPIDFVEYAVSTCILCHDSFLKPEKLFLRSVDIVITERCSLKCRDCSNLMQYYQHPKNYSVKEINYAIDVFCDLIDEVNEFRVIGGEPFMNKEFHHVIRKLTEKSKVKKIVIYTNGTIVPNDYQLEFMKNNKVLVFITDYGSLSKKLNMLIQVLQENKIAFYVQKTPGWTDCSKIRRHFRDSNEQKKIFDSCCVKNSTTLLKGKLFRCPFSANAINIEAIPHYESDFIDIFQELQEPNDVARLKNKMRKFLAEKQFLETCDYCSGRSYGAPEIPPAIQTKVPVDYERCYLEPLPIAEL